MPNYPYPKIIAKFCFLVVLCQVGSTLQHTKSRTELEYGKVSKNKMAANMAAKNVNLRNFRDFLSISTRFFKRLIIISYQTIALGVKKSSTDFFKKKFKMATNMAAKYVIFNNFYVFNRFLRIFFHGYF